MLTALLVGLLGPQPQTVTFSHPCAHSSVVLEALGKELGVTMKPSGSVVDDWFAIKLTDKSVDEVKRLIATGLHAEWVEKTGVTYLTRSAKQHNEEMREEDEALRSSIRRYLERNVIAPIDKQKLTTAMLEVHRARLSGNQQYLAVHVELSRMSPETRFGPSVVRALGEDVIARVGVGRSESFWMYADGRTDMPQELRKAIQDYQKEKTAFDELAASLGAEGSVSTSYGTSTQGLQRLGVSIRRSSDSVTIYLMRQPIDGTAGVHPSSHYLAAFGLGRMRTELPPLDGLQGMIHLDDKEWSYMRALADVRVVGGPQASPADRETARNFARDFRKNDPLTVYGAAPLISVGEMTERDYVALVPDSAMMYGGWLYDAQSTPLEAVWAKWLISLDATEDGPSGTFIIRPFQPSETRESRIDRDAISRIVNASLAQGRVTLEGLTGLAEATGTSRRYFHNMHIVGSVLPIDQNLSSDWIALRAYSALNLAQKAAARNGGYLLPGSALPGAVKDEILQRGSTLGMFFGDGPPDEIDWGYTTRFSGSTRTVTELTERQLDEAECRIVVHSRQLLKPRIPEGSRSIVRLVTADDYVTYSRSDYYVESGPDFSQLAVVDAEKLQLEVRVKDIGYTTFTARSDSAFIETKYVPVSSLPEAWRTAIEAARKRASGGNPSTKELRP